MPGQLKCFMNNWSASYKVRQVRLTALLSRACHLTASIRLFVVVFFVYRRSLPLKLQSRVSFEAMSAEDAMEDGESEGCEVLIVDPPRKVCPIVSPLWHN